MPDTYEIEVVCHARADLSQELFRKVIAEDLSLDQARREMSRAQAGCGEGSGEIFGGYAWCWNTATKDHMTYYRNPSREMIQ